MSKPQSNQVQIILSRPFSGILLGLLLVSNMLTLVAQSSPIIHCQPKKIQTEITHQDIAIIDQLVTIAQRHSADILDAKTALGFSAFEDTVSLELEPSFSIGTSNEEYTESYSEGNFSSTITIDPIRLISVFQKMPALRARLKQSKKQKRVEVVKFYIAYIQALQVVQVMSNRMQAITGDSCIGGFKSNSTSVKATKNVATKEYADMALEMLNAHGQARIALEELAAAVGLSPQETITTLEDSVLKSSP
jgi:hypothetical protein